MYCCRDIFQMFAVEGEGDSTHTIVVLERSVDVIRAFHPDRAAVNDERQRRPDVQGFPRRCCVCTNESQIDS